MRTGGIDFVREMKDFAMFDNKKKMHILFMGAFVKYVCRLINITQMFPRILTVKLESIAF